MSSSFSNLSSAGSVSINEGKTKRHPLGRGKNFHHRYLALCKSGNFKPIREIASFKRDGNANFLVDVYCDRFTHNDWQLIGKAFDEDRSLHRVAFRLRKTYTEVFDRSIRRQADDVRERKNQPVILEKRLLKSLIETLSQCLTSNQNLVTLTLEGIPLDGLCTNKLASGLKGNTTLTELSLARCSIGDDGCEELCRELKLRPNLLTLNLSACQLTERGCQALADTIRFQKIQRFEKSWELSLRYGDIKEDMLFGLRCLYVSHNPAIGDGGLMVLTEVLKDDAWIRQVHLRNCGLTDAGAQLLLDCLNLNATIEMFDIRDNIDISNTACQEILTKLGALNTEAGDGPEMVTTPPKKNSNTITSLRERCEQYEARLESERDRYNQLESTVAELHLRLGDYAMRISELQRKLSMFVDGQHDLLENRGTTEHRSTTAKGSVARLVRKSTALRAAASMPEMMAGKGFAPEPDPHRRTRVIERTIGDSCVVVEEEPFEILHAAKHEQTQGHGDAMPDGWQPAEVDEVDEDKPERFFPTY